MPRGSCRQTWRREGLAWPLPHHLVCVEKSTLPYLRPSTGWSRRGRTCAALLFASSLLSSFLIACQAGAPHAPSLLRFDLHYHDPYSLPQAGAHVRLLEALSRAQAGGHAETVWRRCAARVAPRRSVVDHPSLACRRWRRCATRRRERVARSSAKPPPPFMSARLASGAAGQARSLFKQGTTRRRSAACRQLSFSRRRRAELPMRVHGIYK